MLDRRERRAAQPQAYDSLMRGQSSGRVLYRRRSAVRSRLPGPFRRLIRKGKYDCGDHEWQRGSGDSDTCIHCRRGHRLHRDGPEVLVRAGTPFSERGQKPRRGKKGRGGGAGVREPRRPLLPTQSGSQAQ